MAELGRAFAITRSKSIFVPCFPHYYFEEKRVSYTFSSEYSGVYYTFSNEYWGLRYAFTQKAKGLKAATGIKINDFILFSS